MSSIGIVDGIAKELAQSLNGVQVAWSYFLTTLINFLVFAAFTAIRTRNARVITGLLRTRRLSLQCARTCCLVLSLSCLFFSLSFLGLAEATVVSFTSPLFIVALAAPLLSERVSWQRWAAVLVGLLGAVMVVRPGSAVFQWAALLPLFGALFFALFHILTRKLGSIDSPFTTLFYTFFGGGLLLSAAMPWVWAPMGAAELALAYGAGVLGLFAHGSMVRALTLADASTLAPINYVRLVWAIGIGYVLFREVPDEFTLLGGTVIMCSGLYVVVSATVAASAPRRREPSAHRDRDAAREPDSGPVSGPGLEGDIRANHHPNGR